MPLKQVRILGRADGLCRSNDKALVQVQGYLILFREDFFSYEDIDKIQVGIGPGTHEILKQTFGISRSKLPVVILGRNFSAKLSHDPV